MLMSRLQQAVSPVTRLSVTIVVWLWMNLSVSTQAATTTTPTVKTVEVFTERSIVSVALPTTTIHYYDFQHVQQIEARLPVFSNQPERAEAQFHRWKSSAAGKQAMAQMKASYTPYLKAAQYHLITIPAVVINQRYVIYGTDDVQRALRDFQQYGQQPQQKESQ